MPTTEGSDLVFDIGAHKGEDSDFYLRLGYRVIAVEANPALAEALRRRFAEEIARGKYVLIDKAIAERDGPVTFFVNRKVSVWGTADPNWARRNRMLGADSDEIEVDSIRFADIVATYGCPHYLKVDVEGADMLCMNALKDTNCRPTYISLESTKVSWSDLLKEFDAFESLGFAKFKVVDQTKHNLSEHRTRRFTARDGSEFDYRFEHGATGPFGANLEGAWLTRQQAIRRYARIFLLYKTLGDNTMLSKILGRIPLARRALRLVSWYDTHAMRD